MTNESTKKLAQLIESYLTKNELNVSDLASSSSVSATTIRRILSNEQKPKRSTSEALLEIICNANEANNYLSTYFDQDSNISFSNEHLNKVSNEYILKGGLYYEVAIFLTSENGRYSSDIRSMFGKKGLQIVDEMTNAGAVKEINGKYHFLDSCMLSVNDIYKAMSIACSAESDKVDHSKFVVSYGYQGVTAQGRQELKAFFVSVQEGAFKIVKRHKGSIPVHFGLFCSDLFANKEQQ